MRIAASSRGGMTFRAASGALAVLFVRSHARGEAIYRAMLARGFNGTFPNPGTTSFIPADALFAALAAFIPIVLRLAVERFS